MACRAVINAEINRIHWQAQGLRIVGGGGMGCARKMSNEVPGDEPQFRQTSRAAPGRNLTLRQAASARRPAALHQVDHARFMVRRDYKRADHVAGPATVHRYMARPPRRLKSRGRQSDARELMPCPTAISCTMSSLGLHEPCSPHP
jgi:hypothetical protein